MSTVDQDHDLVQPAKLRLAAPGGRLLQRESIPENVCSPETILPEHRAKRKRRQREFSLQQIDLEKTPMLTLLKRVRSPEVMLRSGTGEADGQEREPADAECKHSALRPVCDPARHELEDRGNVNALPAVRLQRGIEQQLFRRGQKQFALAQALCRGTRTESGRSRGQICDQHNQFRGRRRVTPRSLDEQGLQRDHNTSQAARNPDRGEQQLGASR